MPYLSSFERTAMEKGLEQGLEQGIEVGIIKGLLEGIELDLESDFGKEGQKLLPKFRAIQDQNKLRNLARKLKSAGTIKEVRDMLRG